MNNIVYGKEDEHMMMIGDGKLTFNTREALEYVIANRLLSKLTRDLDFTDHHLIESHISPVIMYETQMRSNRFLGVIDAWNRDCYIFVSFASLTLVEGKDIRKLVNDYKFVYDKEHDVYEFSRPAGMPFVIHFGPSDQFAMMLDGKGNCAFRDKDALAYAKRGRNFVDAINKTDLDNDDTGMSEIDIPLALMRTIKFTTVEVIQGWNPNCYLFFAKDLKLVEGRDVEELKSFDVKLEWDNIHYVTAKPVSAMKHISKSLMRARRVGASSAGSGSDDE